jgi:hypothetical protein
MIGITMTSDQFCSAPKEVRARDPQNAIRVRSQASIGQPWQSVIAARQGSARDEATKYGYEARHGQT